MEHIFGLCIGLSSFLIIGLFHPLVIKAEYYWSAKSWWIFLVVGIIAAIFSIVVTNLFASTLLGVLSFSSFWSIKEVIEQEERVKKGWFKRNPNRDNYPFD